MAEPIASAVWGQAPAAPFLVLDVEGGRAEQAAAKTGRGIEAVRTVADAVARWAGAGPFAALLAGPEAAAELAGHGVRAVAVTESTELDAAENALAAGAADVVAADATFEEIERVIAPAGGGTLRETSHLHGANLAELSAEAARIAKALETLSRAEPRAEGEQVPVTAGYVRGVIRARRARTHYFKGDLFADPAWDILLDLMAARLEAKRVSVSSLCIAAAVPPTTALRWIKSMTDEGLLERKPDPIDGRRVFIDLSDDASTSMAAYLSQAARTAAAI